MVNESSILREQVVTDTKAPEVLELVSSDLVQPTNTTAIIAAARTNDKILLIFIVIFLPYEQIR